MVQRLINGIQVQNNLTIKLENTKVKDNKLVNWLDYMYYISTKVTEAFRVAKYNKNQ